MVGVIRGVIGGCLLIGATPALCQDPLPPPSRLEFFEPTIREHSLAAECYGGGSAALTWRFDGKGAILQAFEFDGHPLAVHQLEKMQGWMSEIGGDVLVVMACGHHAATLSIVSSQLAGTSGAPGIRVELRNGELSEVARYNFDK